MRDLEKFLRRCFGNERRCAPRFAISQPVTVRLGEAENEISALAIEISETGMLLRMSHCIPKKTRLGLATIMPASDDDTRGILLEGAGRVANVRRLMTGEYDTAVEFRRLEIKKSRRAITAPALAYSFATAAETRFAPPASYYYGPEAAAFESESQPIAAAAAATASAASRMGPVAAPLPDPEAAALLKKWFVKAS
jgi:PilZ domain